MARWMVSCFTALLVGLSSCGETEVTWFGDGPEGPPLSVTYLLGGGAVDELLSLSLTIDDVRLLSHEDVVGGRDGIGALLAPAAAEVLGLDDRAKLLTTRYYGDGLYTHVRVDFGSDPVSGRWHGGEAVEWTPRARSSVLMALPEPWRAARGETLARTLLLELDPAESVLGLGAAQGFESLGFEPVLRVRGLAPGERVRADDFWGGLVSASSDQVVWFFASEVDRTVANRRLPAAVVLDPSTLLLDPASLPVTELSGLTLEPALAGARFLVQGDHTAGGPGYQAQMWATSIQLDSLVPASGSGSAIVLEARIIERLADDAFRVRLIEFERGEALARSALPNIDTMSSLEVIVGASDQVQIPWHGLGSRQDLHIGMRVKFHFAAFQLAPLRASRVLIQGRAEHRGVWLAREPGQSLAMLALDPDAAAIEGGLVAGASTAVAVTPGSLFARLDVEGGPLVRVSQAPPGLRAIVRGRLTGTPGAPAIFSGEVILRPGRFMGEVTSWAQGEEAFDARVDWIEAPFGGGAVAPPFRVRITENCVFEGAAASSAALHELFVSLAPGESLEVKVSGIAGENPDEVLAYQLQSAIR
ncbi:MAG: hypothetical protein ACJAZN_003633 [Planctomycetota bacterium]|jgi:hypothetical protein